MERIAADGQAAPEIGTMADQRTATRYTSLIRAAKLTSSQGEFVCVIRDVSSSGISLRTFHDLPIGQSMGLELQNGESYELERVRQNGTEASFRFASPVEVDSLIRETWKYPRRQLRLNIAIPLVLTTLSGRHKAVTHNISQQGCGVECDALLAIDQSVGIESTSLPDIRGKVRWRRDHEYGMVFENTFTLRDFALVAAALQCPSLLRSCQQ